MRVEAQATGAAMGGAPGVGSSATFDDVARPADLPPGAPSGGGFGGRPLGVLGLIAAALLIRRKAAPE